MAKNNNFNVRVQTKRDTSSNWTRLNPILLDGEIIIVDTAEGDVRLKVGNGTSVYTALPFLDEYIDFPIPDVSGQIAIHNEDENSHQDIRASVVQALADAKEYTDDIIENFGSGVIISPDEPTKGDVWIDTDEVIEIEESGVVLSFNGRDGDVLPEDGDYTAEMVGADKAGAADAALADAKVYVDEQIALIPTPDVSGQINVHNVDTNSHADIRSAIPTKTSDLNNDSNFATIGDVESKVAELVNSAPETLNTLDELAHALGDDPNFATTMANQIGNKVDKVDGMGLSTNDYTTDEKNKLAGIEIGAKANVNADWNATSGDAQILNKPTLGTLAAKSNVEKSDLASDVQISLDKADVALADAKAYTDAQIATIPTPDVSGQISVHNEDKNSHQDIRTSVTQALTDAKEYTDDAIENIGPGVAISAEEPTKENIWIDIDDNPDDEYDVVLTFNGRVGEIVPQVGDYTAEMVGAATMEEVNEAIAAIPTPDVSGQIAGHDSNTEAHADIRAELATKTNPNLLDNWYFADPIDQRGGAVCPPNVDYYLIDGLTKAGTTTKYFTAKNEGVCHSIVVDGTTYYVAYKDMVRGYAGAGYTIDRWTKVGEPVVTLTENGLKLSSASQYQWFNTILEHDLTGQQVTLSILYSDGVLQSGSTVVSSEAKSLFYRNNWHLRVHVNNGKTEVHFFNGGSGEIVMTAIKLELGSTQTLAHQDENGNWVLNEIPDHNTELLKCCMSKADSTDEYANNKKTASVLGAVDTQVLSSSVAQVGDLMSSTRTDLDDTWLLCNGDEVSIHDYSELAEMFPSLVGAWTTIDVYNNTSYTTTIKCIAYANGYWVAGGTSNNNAVIAYTKNPAGSWTTKSLWSSGISSINCITYANGYWVAGGVYNSGYARIAYTTNLDQVWTTKDLWSGNSTINCITYANGHWVVGGIYNSSYARIAYTTNPTTSWTTKDLWSTGTSSINCITYSNGYWVVGGVYYYGSIYYVRIAYTTDVTTEWTIKDIGNSNSNAVNKINSIIHANDYWAVCCNNKIAYTKDLTADWEFNDSFPVLNLSNLASVVNISDIIYVNGYWVVCMDVKLNLASNYCAAIVYSTDLAGVWKIKKIWDSGSNDAANCISCANGYWIVCGNYTQSSNKYARIARRPSETLTLPTITQSESYVYIKVKEE